MMIFDKSNRRTKTFRPLHNAPGPAHSDFILLPYGYMCNREYEEAIRGDLMVFHDGAHKVIHTVCRIPIDACCDALCRMRYGVSIKRVLMQWQNNAVLLGSGKKSVSEDECLIVFYGEEE